MPANRNGEYILIDEPRPGALSQAVVNPVWPLLAVMFAGGGVSWIWSIVNTIGMGSPTKRREIALAVGGFAGALGISLLVMYLVGAKVLPKEAFKYGLLALTVWKLAISYWIYFVQSRTFGVYEYYSGPVRNGLMILIIAYAVTRPLLKSLNASPLGLLLYMAVS